MCDNAEQQQTEAEASIRPPASERLLPWLAALSAAGLTYRVVKEPEGWTLRVPADQAQKVQTELAEYERINKNWPPSPVGPVAVHPLSAGVVFGSVAVASGLLAFFHRTGPSGDRSVFHAAGCADSTAIIHYAWWRAVTSLTLHADLPHVLGNALCLLLFGGEISRQIGVGLGWLLILFTGFAGNMVAAYAVGPGRAAIGASTATFGALGLLSSFQFCRNYWHNRTLRGIWNRTWVPLGAGVALLALLGVQDSPRVDLAGHFFGFLVGLVAGGMAAPLLKRQLPAWIQTVAAIFGLCAVYVAWHLALRGG